MCNNQEANIEYTGNCSIDINKDGMNTLRMIGSTLPFDSYDIFLKFEKKTYFDKEKYFRLTPDFKKVEVSEGYIKQIARNKSVLIINEKQILPLINLALENNEKIARLKKSEGELIYKLGFITEEIFQNINYIDS